MLTLPAGMILSFVLVSEDNSVIEKIIAEVTDEELNFMKIFGIGNANHHIALIVQ
jgi:hypothetical protein